MKTNTTIRNCLPVFSFRCPKVWENLAPTEDETVRHCTECDQNVHLCTTDEETLVHARAGHCIARQLPDESELVEMWLGRMDVEKVDLGTPEQIAAAEWTGRERGINDSLRNIDSPRSCPQCNYPAPTWRVACRVCGFEFGRAT